MGTIKDRNGKDLTEASDVKNRWQEYIDKLYKKGLNDPDNHDGVVTNLEADILECEVKWAMRRITISKASACDGILAELFQMLNMMLLKCCIQYASKYGISAVATGLEKVSFHSNPKERQCRRMFTLLHSSHTLVK